MVINAADRFACQHTLVGTPGGFECATCSFRVSELPLSKKSGAAIFRPTFNSGLQTGERLTKSA